MPNMNRKNLRLPHYDYSQNGWYFITIVTYKRICLLGSIIDGEMILNDAGKMIDSVCQNYRNLFPIRMGTVCYYAESFPCDCCYLY